MRLIDADALKEAINDNGCRHSHYFDVFDVIDDAPTVERPKWIPIEERLPEIRSDINSRTSDTVFVCLRNRTMHMAFYCDDGIWRFCESGESKEPMWDAVIAWMPLPERYEKEGEAE